MRVIGITGGVGSGKSTITNLLRREYGAVVIEADQVAKELMEPGGACYEAVLAEFGSSLRKEDATIDREKLSAIVFADANKLERLNSLVHPLVEKQLKQIIAQNPGQLVAIEAALPTEAGFCRLCSQIWYIHVPVEVRIDRLMESRGYSRQKCLQIINQQLQEEEFRKIADVVIENDGTLQETKQQIQKIMDCGSG